MFSNSRIYFICENLGGTVRGCFPKSRIITTSLWRSDFRWERREVTRKFSSLYVYVFTC